MGENVLDGLGNIKHVRRFHALTHLYPFHVIAGMRSFFMARRIDFPPAVAMLISFEK